ncbi:hypothetical protein LSCM1_05100 [Leishmania martiniquensis]|uniref:HpcH/HpaI aldolase/citrate lyase domain-containing protein n=1 Tax=Leishmania martiniquensis TaxID=1580590 RepID=A0A836KP92_9TRYP|nr:hypothetical protein LSCM1_05100 [Leishmania martiniquensis]
MRRRAADAVGAPHPTGTLRSSAAFFHERISSLRFQCLSNTAATRTPSRGLWSFTPSPGRGSADLGVDKGLAGWLRRLHFDFQVYRDRQLDAAAAEEAQAGIECIDEDKHCPASTTSTAYRGQTSDAHARRSCSPLISRNPGLCPRSVLFVPGSNTRALAKIPTLPADCFILDLENSVGRSSKRRARENIQAFVEDIQKEQRVRRSTEATTTTAAAAAGGAGTADEVGDPYPRLIVRINSPDFDVATAMLDLELVGLLGPAIEGIALPKTTVRTYALIEDYVCPHHQLWAFFETPLSITQAPLICKQRVYRYAVMGYNDLSAELQLPMATPSPLPGATDDGSVSEAVKESLHITARLPLWQSTAQVLLAARAHDMFVIDAVFNNPTDKAAFRRSLQECRLLGLNGKTLIHPSQIEPTNAAFTPAEAEVVWAQRIIEAIERCKGDVTTVDGNMMEELHQRQARHVLALHRSAKLEEMLLRTEAPKGGTGNGASKEATDGTAETVAGGADSNGSGRQPRHPPSRHRPLS